MSVEQDALDVPTKRKPQTDKPRDAYSSGIGLLSRREHSARELKVKLARKGHAKEEISDAIGRLADRKYQSDDRFGIVIARTRIAQGYGPARIRAELKSHGLSDAAIRAAVEAADADWLDVAARQLKRRFGARPAPDADERARRAQFLLRRGFDPATVRAVTRADVDDSGELD
ncbi:MAG TPA: regulatory protein RecX [Rhodanobacteraceae bacterium]|jgi:regulatory protein|nr:regulatory protein RecX [Rhodanobacteraceae bacterium]